MDHRRLGGQAEALLGANTRGGTGEGQRPRLNGGISDRLIDTIDPDVVALAANQGLNDVVAEKDTEIAELRADMDALKAVVAELLQR
jgi:hypothetical protein